MGSTAMTLAVAGSIAVMAGWGSYLATIPSGKVPRRPLGTMLVQLAGTVLAIAALVASTRSNGSPELAVVAAGATALLMGPFFFYLLSQRRTPVGKITVSPGDKLPPFTTLTSEGDSIDSASLLGRRVLLKFFRGHW